MAMFFCLSNNGSSSKSSPRLITSSHRSTKFEYRCSDFFSPHTIIFFKFGRSFQNGRMASTVDSSSTTKMLALQSPRINLLVSALLVAYKPTLFVIKQKIIHMIYICLLIEYYNSDLIISSGVLLIQLLLTNPPAKIPPMVERNHSGLLNPDMQTECRSSSPSFMKAFEMQIMFL